MNIAARIRATIRRLVGSKTTSHTITYINMTPEQQEGMEKAFAIMDEMFKEMDRVVGLDRPTH